MNLKLLVAGALLLPALLCAGEMSAASPSYGGQSSAASIAGIWEGKTDGVPAITLTIKEVGNKLTGSVTFYRIEDDGNGPAVTGKDTRELIDPKFEGKIFSYQIKGRNDELVSLQMEVTAKDEGLMKMRRMINGNVDYVPVKVTRSQEKREGPAPKQPPANAAVPPRAVAAETLRSIETLVDDLTRKDEFSGVVLVADQGKPIFHKAVGLASKEFKVPNSLETRFNLGSINKIFTQILVGQLAAAGKLPLDDHMGKYLPDYPNKEAAEKVTVRQLLTMTSGIGDFFGPEFDATPKNKIRDLKDYIPLFASKPLLFAPGTRNQYSNGGYVVLGLIIEKVTGRSYYDWAGEKIFGPTGMNDTAYFEADVPVPNVASGYTRRTIGQAKRDHWSNNFYTRPARGSSAGGGYSTAGDLLKFANALHSGNLVIPNFNAASSSGAIAPRGPDGLAGAGRAPGINSTLDTGVAGRYTVIVMSNYDPPSAMDLAKQIRRLLGTD